MRRAWRLAPVRLEVESEMGEDRQRSIDAGRQTTKIASRAKSATTPTII
jgi:hypothetical protein